MTVILSDYLLEKRQLINQQLIHYVRDYTVPGRLQDAMLYSIEAGGKRLRPILLIATAEAFGANVDKAIAVACGLEMIHTYSLIHDDLPAMDDDDFRRGLPTSHRRFDEATAILAGDALLTLSSEIIVNDQELNDRERVFLIRELSRASGASGMVEGQMQDMLSEDKQIPLQELENIHKKKTGKLLNFAIIAGTFLGNASNEKFDEMKKMGEALGLIFQIQDDILDVTGDAEKIGKPVGSDEGNRKSTYPQLLGLDGAREQMEAYVETAQGALLNAGVNNTILSELIHYLSSRDH
ncbi:polyprenyl synthetase family protein [Halobacillus halophilus]|uniref:polyprenyl synthetase family protein n=1 Tax=Halobacillus halophilus TaxID=1570 RepID=UPI001CD7B6BE|nr:farnesyl diphosphate synthase [Halobacillus halophilus]MCA1009634.1 polyprenyl synthetase family protein [Halobacillus halophilus]